MCSGSGTDDAGFQIEKVQDKLIGVLGRNPVFLEFLVGKIREVIRDNHVCPPANGGRQNMPIIRVWQGEGGNQLFKIFNEAIPSMQIHEVSRAMELHSREVWSILKDRPYPLVVNL